MDRQSEMDKLADDIQRAIRENKREEALILTGRLRGMRLRKDNSFTENLGKFESAMKVVNLAHQALLHAITSGNMQQIRSNAARIREQLRLAHLSLSVLEGENHD
jgi:hypothetical protein